MQRLQRRGAGPDLVGERREAKVDALAGIALALPVQRLMLTELLKQVSVPEQYFPSYCLT